MAATFFAVGTADAFSAFFAGAADEEYTSDQHSRDHRQNNNIYRFHSLFLSA